MSAKVFNRWLSLLVSTLALAACTLPLVWATEQPGLATTTTPTSEIPSPGPSPIRSQAAPTNTPEPTLAGPSQPAPTLLPTPDWTPTPQPLPFRVQPGSPAAVANFAHPELGCEWMGVGGQVFDAQGNPLQSLIVELGGELAGAERRALAASGSAPAFGPAGYEFELAQRTLGSQGTLWVQLFDLEGQPLSEEVPIDTYNDCQRSLILVNFVAAPVSTARSYLPLVSVSR